MDCFGLLIFESLVKEVSALVENFKRVLYKVVFHSELLLKRLHVFGIGSRDDFVSTSGRHFQVISNIPEVHGLVAVASVGVASPAV